MNKIVIYTLSVLSIAIVFGSLSYSQDVENKVCNTIQITQGDEDSRNPSVCGNGTGILFISRADLLNNGHPDQNDLFFADIIDPFNPVFYQLTNDEETERRISISDDCSKIAFSSDADLTGGNPNNDDQIFLGNIGNPNSPIYSQITNVDDGFFSPRISGDGTKISFSSNADITGMNPDESVEYFIFDDNNFVVPFEQLTNSPATGSVSSGPVINTDGTRVAFTTSQNFVPPNMNGDGGRELYLSEIDFNSPNPPPNTLFQLTQIPGDFLNQGADITGDGERIVFASSFAITGMSPDPERDIFIADVTDPQVPVFTRITKSAAFTASSGVIDNLGNNIAFITENPQFAPIKDGDTETIVMADVTNATNPSFMTLVNFPPGTDLDDLSAPNEFTLFAFESDENLVSNTNTDETEEIFIILTDQCGLIAIPTLSEWGLIAMASILGVVGFMVARRRKVAA